MVNSSPLILCFSTKASAAVAQEIELGQRKRQEPLAELQQVRQQLTTAAGQVEESACGIDLSLIKVIDRRVGLPLPRERA
jgi:hypothetical protein